MILSASRSIRRRCTPPCCAGLSTATKASGALCAGRSGTPALLQRVRNTQLVEDAGDNEVDDLVDALRVLVKARAGRQDHGAGAGQAQHVFEVNDRERGFTWNQNQFAAFLEYHVGGAFDQVVRQ